MLQVALYKMFSMLHIPLHLPVGRGQSGLGHVGLLKELFGAKPARIGAPGFSTTFTTVPLGPGFIRMISLRFLASLEFSVIGTIRVVVAPIFLNHVDLSPFIFCFLSSLDR